jgi:signal transduction histidine kinase
MRLSLWPQSLFGRLIAASVLAVLVSELTGLALIARERQYFVLQGNVREWSRRIAELTFMLQPLNATEREATITRLIEQPRRFEAPAILRSLLGGARRGRFPQQGETPGSRLPAGPPPEISSSRPESVAPDGPPPPLEGPPRGLPPTGLQALRAMHQSSSQLIFIPLPLSSDFEPTFKQQLQTTLGTAYKVAVAPTPDVSKRAIQISAPFFEAREGSAAQLYDVDVSFPDGDAVVFRVTRMPWGAPVSRNLLINLALLVVILVIALYVTARSITRPLSKLARAAEGLGRNVRQPKLEERGARELQEAARAFNTMQDKLQRYLDSRTRVLAAMSHDLKTPLTRLRLQVETTLDDPAIQARFGKELDEMESMVRGALALFRGLDDDEALAPIDINALVATLQSEFTEMKADVTVEGKAPQPYVGKPQALKRCLTNLVANAVKFGMRAKIVVEDGTSLVIRVRDEGPGIPLDELERVFEPFYRLESSRNRDTGGTGLGLSIARDVAQAHAGSLVAHNLPGRGLETLLVLPRHR